MKPLHRAAEAPQQDRESEAAPGRGADLCTHTDWVMMKRAGEEGEKKHMKANEPSATTTDNTTTITTSMKMYTPLKAMTGFRGRHPKLNPLTSWKTVPPQSFYNPDPHTANPRENRFTSTGENRPKKQKSDGRERLSEVKSDSKINCLVSRASAILIVQIYCAVLFGG